MNTIFKPCLNLVKTEQSSVIVTIPFGIQVTLLFKQNWNDPNPTMIVVKHPTLEEKTNDEILNWAFKEFNHEGLSDYIVISSSTTKPLNSLRSMSVGDIILISREGKGTKKYECMPVGWSEI